MIIVNLRIRIIQHIKIIHYWFLLAPKPLFITFLQFFSHFIQLCLSVFYPGLSNGCPTNNHFFICDFELFHSLRNNSLSCAEMCSRSSLWSVFRPFPCISDYPGSPKRNKADSNKTDSSFLLFPCDRDNTRNPCFQKIDRSSPYLFPLALFLLIVLLYNSFQFTLFNLYFSIYSFRFL